MASSLLRYWCSPNMLLPMANSISMMTRPLSSGSRHSSVASSHNSSSALVCLTVLRWVLYRSHLVATGVCQVMPHPKCGWKSLKPSNPHNFFTFYLLLFTFEILSLCKNKSGTERSKQASWWLSRPRDGVLSCWHPWWDGCHLVWYSRLPTWSVGLYRTVSAWEESGGKGL